MSPARAGASAHHGGGGGGGVVVIHDDYTFVLLARYPFCCSAVSYP